MTAFKLENNGTAKDILVNGQLIAKATEAGLQATKPFKGPASADADDYVRQDQVFGVGQTRQDVTASRAINVVYVNTGSKPILAIINALATNSTSAYTSINVIGADAVAVGYGKVSGEACLCSAIILPGEQYRYDKGSNTGTPSIWEIS